MIENRDDLRNGLNVEREGERFQITGINGLWIKGPSDANWHEAVKYISLSAGDDKIYCRRLDDFMRKFSLIEEEQE